MSEGTGKPGAYIRSILIYVPGFFCAFVLLVSIRVLEGYPVHVYKIIIFKSGGRV